MDHRVHTAARAITEDLRRPLDLEALARSVNLSPGRLRQLFRRELGLTPARYLKSLRLRRAKELAETTFLGVKQIMREVGMRDESHFVRDFREAFGLPPGRHRVNHMRMNDLADE